MKVKQISESEANIMTALDPNSIDPFESAQRVAYATVEWRAEDVMRLRPGWDHARATAFLAVVETRLAATLLDCGWTTLRLILDEQETHDRRDR